MARERETERVCVWVEGRTGWQFEDGLRKTMPDWLGKEPTTLPRKNFEAVRQGALSKREQLRDQASRYPAAKSSLFRQATDNSSR